MEKFKKAVSELARAGDILPVVVPFAFMGFLIVGVPLDNAIEKLLE